MAAKEYSFEFNSQDDYIIEEDYSNSTANDNVSKCAPVATLQSCSQNQCRLYLHFYFNFKFNLIFFI